MVLKNVLKENPKSILIEDSCGSKGRPLFNSLLNHFSNKGFKIQHIQYDFPLEKIHTNWTRHDFFSDPLGFNSSNMAFEESLQSVIEECKDKNTQYVVAIDSLSPLLLRLPATDIFSTIRQIILKKNVNIIALVHSDVHSKETLRSLDYCFSCHLKLATHTNKSRCIGRLKSGGGKIIDSDEVYCITPKLELTDVENFEQLATNTPDAGLPNVTPKSTFRLGLNQNEESARSKVVLPYIRKPSNAESKGKIFYEAENNDWEDEDPDDDLEL